MRRVTGLVRWATLSVLVFGVLVLPPRVVWAVWDDRTIDFAMSAELPHEQLSSEATTAWAAIRSYSYKFKNYWHLVSNGPGLVARTVPSSRFSTGEIEVATSIRKEGLTVQARPLIVFLPGISGGIYSPSVYRAVSNFGARGYHVIAIANPWSVEYVRSRPIDSVGESVKPGAVEEEAQTVLELVKTTQEKWFPKGSITSVSVVGESYGGMLALVTGVYDGRGPGLIDGTVTVFGPPLGVGMSLKNLDQGFEDTKTLYKSRCSKTQMSDAARIFAQSPFAPWHTHLTDCVGAYIYNGFQKKVVDVAHALQDSLTSVITGVPEDLSFKEFVEKFTPKHLARLEAKENTRLIDWVKQYPTDRIHQLQILAAEDDFLNQRDVADDHDQSWDEVKDQFGAQWARHLIVLPRGGHVGFVGLSWFQGFLDRSHGLSNATFAEVVVDAMRQNGISVHLNDGLNTQFPFAP